MAGVATGPQPKSLQQMLNEWCAVTPGYGVSYTDIDPGLHSFSRAHLIELSNTDPVACSQHPLYKTGGRGGGRSGELELGVEADSAPAPDARLSATPPAHNAEARVAALEVLFVGEVQPGPLFMRIAALEGQPGDPPTNLRDALARLGALESMT